MFSTKCFVVIVVVLKVNVLNIFFKFKINEIYSMGPSQLRDMLTCFQLKTTGSRKLLLGRIAKKILTKKVKRTLTVKEARSLCSHYGLGDRRYLEEMLATLREIRPNYSFS